MYSDSFVCRTEEEARLIARFAKSLLKQDMIINRYNGRTEPFDWVTVCKNDLKDGKLVIEDINVYDEE